MWRPRRSPTRVWAATRGLGGRARVPRGDAVNGTTTTWQLGATRVHLADATVPWAYAWTDCSRGVRTAVRKPGADVGARAAARCALAFRHAHPFGEGMLEWLK
jgi:hypothetical protein